MEKLYKCGKKLKQMVKFFTRSCDDYQITKNDVCPRPVHCEELFLQRRGRRGLGDDDPFVEALVAAQNHFSLRPNIYI
ncbi:hypothetical protein LINGRAPRIM_LOCUS3335 [Linum grandiflorum]